MSNTPTWAADALAIEHSITVADLDIEELKCKLKDAKELREKLVSELRNTVKRQSEPLLADVVDDHGEVVQ